MKSLCLVVLAVALASAQDWVACYDSGPFSDDDARAVATDPQGNSYIVGFTHGITTVKYTPAGETVWTRAYADSSYEEYGQMAVTLDRLGDVLVAAAVYAPPSNGFVLRKYHPNGTLAWGTEHWIAQANQGAYGSPVKLVTDRQDCIYLAGTAVNDTTVTDIVVCKFDAAGNPRWTRTFDGPRHDADQAEALSLRGDTELFVAGMTMDASARYNATVLTYDTAGTLRWTYAYQPNTDFKSWAKGLGVCSDGSSYIVGWRQNVSGASRVCLALRLDHDGDTTWSRTDSSEGDALATDGAGNLFAVGQVNKSIGYNARVWKYSPAGQLLWRADYRTIDTVTTRGLYAMPTENGEVYVSGWRFAGQGRHEFYVAKYDADGHWEWTALGDTTDDNDDEPAAACTDFAGNVFLTGSRQYPSSLYRDFVTMKFRASGAVEEQPATPVEPEHIITVSPSVVSSRCRFSVAAGAGERQSVLSIADIAGRVVRGIPVPAGKAGDRVSVTWDTRNEHGQLVPNGVYFVRVAQAQAQAQAVCKVIVQRQ